MNNLILITSIVNVPLTPLSYTHVRSVFSSMERFEQTKNTINSIRTHIPNSKIILIECSNLTLEQTNYFIHTCDYFLNLIHNENDVNNIYSKSKSLGESTMTIAAINYIIQQNILFDNFFKISGRYWLSEHFEYSNFDNDHIVIHHIDNDPNNTSTCLYKLHKSNLSDFYLFLINNTHLMLQCIGHEVLFARFLNTPKLNKIVHLKKIGVKGFISVSNDFINQ